MLIEAVHANGRRVSFALCDEARGVSASGERNGIVARLAGGVSRRIPRGMWDTVLRLRPRASVLRLCSTEGLLDDRTQEGVEDGRLMPDKSRPSAHDTEQAKNDQQRDIVRIAHSVARRVEDVAIDGSCTTPFSLPGGAHRSGA